MHGEARLGPGRAHAQFTVLTQAGTIHHHTSGIDAALLAGARQQTVARACHRPAQVFLVLAAVKHARPFQVHGPGIGRADGRGGRGPVPAEKDVDERVAVGQGRLARLVAHQAAQFVAVGQAPVVPAAVAIPVQVSHLFQGLGPGAGKGGDGGVPAPEEVGESVMHDLALHGEPLFGPGHAAPEFPVLAATRTGDLPAGLVPAAGLARMEHVAHGVCLLSSGRGCAAGQRPRAGADARRRRCARARAAQTPRRVPGPSPCPGGCRPRRRPCRFPCPCGTA